MSIYLGTNLVAGNPDSSNFVEKTGDTMTGELIVENNNVTIQNTTFDSTTTTAPAEWTSIGMFRMFDENGKYTGYVENAFTTRNYVQTTLGARRIVGGENKSATIKAMVDSSGNGRVEMYPPHIQKNVSIINGGVTKGTSPSGDSYNEILFNDKTDDDTWANTRLGAVQHVTRANGGSSMLIRAYRNQAASTSYAEMSVTVDSSGTASCSFSNTIRCDGQYVESTSQPGDSVNMNASTNVTYTLTQIPNDGHKYMVLIIASPVTGSTSGNYVLAQVTSTICPGGINVCRAQTRTSSTMAATGAAWIPVGSDRKITLNRSTSYTGTCNLYVRGYRRIGDNG